MKNVPLLISLGVIGLAAGSALAPDEDTLKNAFMGRQVAIRVDMPASHKGVDLRFDREVPFDLKENADRIREHDAALVAGDVIPVTYIKVKGDLIEFHLGGGGFNWFSDKTTRTATSSTKTARESDLEKEIKSETDRERKRRLERELDDLRRDRRNRDDRERRDVDEHNLRARDRDMERALRSGSRFNLRFKSRVPPDALTPQGLEALLDPWVDFSGRSGRSNSAASSSRDQDSRSGDWRKGMLRSEMEEALGRPREERTCPGSNGGLECRIAWFEDRGDEVEATFVEGVLVRFAVRRK